MDSLIYTVRREHSSIARPWQQKHHNGGFRRFATWAVSYTCASADAGVWLLGNETIVGEIVSVRVCARTCFDWGFRTDGRVMIPD